MLTFMYALSAICCAALAAMAITTSVAVCYAVLAICFAVIAVYELT